MTYRLPRSIVPTHYRLELAPDLEACRFEGTASIDVDVIEPTNEVVVNAADLDVRAATVGGQPATVTLGDDETATVTVETPLAPGPAVVTFEFSGRLNDELRGFYRSTFTDADGKERVIATTQFESTDARRAFPCWDEPDLKATFDVRLRVPDGMIGLSNGAEVARDGEWVTFATTMKMSTYLVAFVVGPLVATPPVDVDGVPLRVVAAPGRERLADFALEVGAHALRYFAEYFDIAYPAGKLDLVALPDFAFGAMENLGCVTFRETALLVDRERASRLELERVADVVAHEIAHMWFGDLVTMKWWNGIWLNEAFATFMEVAAVDAFRPNWERWVSFSTERAAAMVVDGLASTRPIEYEVVSPADADGMFDVLTYQKGGAVLRMLETYLGPERFREGIRLYLRRHAYANTETGDLWDAIEEATGEPVRSIMDTWIFQGGYPVVTSSATALSQEPFRYTPSAESAGWDVPILVGESDRVLLSEVSVGPVAGVVNAGGWGFFRTRYDPPIHDRFASLAPVERFNLVSDTWALTLAGTTPLSEFLELFSHLAAEEHPSVWQAGLGGIDLLHRILPSPSLSSFVRDVASAPFAALGTAAVAGEHERAGRLRGLLLEALGTIGASHDAISFCRDAFASGLLGVEPDLWAAVAAVTAWNGGADEYEVFWERIRSAPTPQDELRYLVRLPIFGDVGLLERTLDATLGDIRSQNGAFVIAAAIANRRVGVGAWAWLESHWDDVIKRLPVNSHGRMLEGATARIDDGSLAAIPPFLAKHPIPAARKQIDQILERQRVNAVFAGSWRATLEERFGG